MDRQLMKDIRGVVEKAIADNKEAFKAMGVEVKLGAGSYSPSNGSIKIEIADVAGGVVKTKEAVALERNAMFLGLPADILGKPVRFGSDDFTIEGINRGGSVVIKRKSDGKMSRSKLERGKLALGIRTTPPGVTRTTEADQESAFESKAS